MYLIKLFQLLEDFAPRSCTRVIPLKLTRELHPQLPAVKSIQSIIFYSVKRQQLPLTTLKTTFSYLSAVHENVIVFSADFELCDVT